MASLLLDVPVFAFIAWLGCYVLARDPRKPRLPVEVVLAFEQGREF